MVTRRDSLGFLSVLAAAILSGCAAEGPATDPAPTAECPVCRENGDLACLKVKIRESTPRLEYQGRTYYFCSDECLAEFQKNPAKYVGK
jgi:YHS domain-containing protein